MKLLLFCFLAAFVCANLIVKHFGPTGLWISSALLIPFDFVTRCIIHERLKGYRLILTLFLLTVAAAAITVALNWNAINIAAASVLGFIAAQIGGGVFYQANKYRSFFFKVNISDLVCIVLDSVVFQVVAFSMFSAEITGMQILIKFLGGLVWYLILFRALKLQDWTRGLPKYTPPAPPINLDEHEKQIA
jgi:uncharacterized PurR-regulated membrane protein YhhQ (DUF165 family)